MENKAVIINKFDSIQKCFNRICKKNVKHIMTHHRNKFITRKNSIKSEKLRRKVFRDFSEFILFFLLM